jgi:membrane fusion protein, multidrug efflux system
LRPVRIAAYTTDGILVASGIRDGDRIVTNGGKLLRPDATVEIVEEAAP